MVTVWRTILMKVSTINLMSLILIGGLKEIKKKILILMIIYRFHRDQEIVSVSIWHLLKQKLCWFTSY
jgi:hypothetical protein